MLSETMGWAATYGGGRNEHANSIQQTSDGGYIVAGGTSTLGAGGYDVWVVKLKPDGTVEWQKAYGGVEYEEAYSIQQTSDGGYIVVGATLSFSTGGDDVWVLKLRADGTVEWQKAYGGDGNEWARSIQQTRDGGYIVAGDTNSFEVRRADIWVLKLKPDGTVEWQKTYGGDETEGGNSIQQTRDGGYIVAGWTSSFGAGHADVWVLKLKPDGTVKWQKAYGGEGTDVAESVRQTNDGGHIVTGRTKSFGAVGYDLWVLKLGPDGDIEWQKTYGGVNQDNAHSVQQTIDGGYIVAGDAGERPVDISWADAWVLKLGPDGTVAWQKTYGGVNHETARSIQQTREGGYIVAGSTRSFFSKGLAPGLWVLKLKPDGSIGPSCDFIRDTSISGKDSSATAKTTAVSPKDSGARPRDSQATTQDTNASAHFLSP